MAYFKNNEYFYARNKIKSFKFRGFRLRYIPTTFKYLYTQINF